MSASRRWIELTLLVLADPASAAAPPIVHRDLDSERLPPGVIARLGGIRWRITGSGRLKFSADGRFLLSNGDPPDGLAILDARTGKRHRTLEQPFRPLSEAFTDFALDSRGKYLISLDPSANRIYRWDFRRGRVLSWINASPEGLFHMALSPTARSPRWFPTGAWARRASPCTTGASRAWCEQSLWLATSSGRSCSARTAKP